MARLIISFFIAVSATQLCFSQQARTVVRVGDAFYGPVKLVRTEMVRVRMEGDKEIEGPRVVTQVVTYSSDGLTKETVSPNPSGTIRQKTIEKFSPSGRRESYTVYDPNGNQLTKITNEYDNSGNMTSETRHNRDGSVQSQMFMQVQHSSSGMVAVSKISNGTAIETAINEQTPVNPETPAKVSKWSTMKPDGSRQENIFAVDSAGDHNDETITYKPDGSLAGRRVSKVNRDVTRLEATEYDASGSVQKRTLHTRAYDSHRNLKEIVNYRWNAAFERFDPFMRTYNHIEYFQ